MTNKSIKKIAASLVACLGLGISVCSAGELDYSSTPGSTIQFNGDSTFTFAPAANNLIIAGSAFLGEITGTYTIGDITTDSTGSSAPVTGTGTFVVHDGAGFDLTATLVWNQINQSGGSGSLNLFGLVNLSNITYSGSNPGLVALKNAGTALNILTFQFVPAVSLQTMKTGTPSTSYSGSVYWTDVPTCNCTLNFNGLSRTTNCPGETIPAVTATQNCGSGSVSVPVTLVSAITNGACPQIITLTYGATDGCNNPHTFVQTNIVNCAPICTITTSVTTTTVGTSNLTASVADAGPGAIYEWSVLNGTITAGQGAPKLTFTAGNDPSNPISILVKIINQTGCQNNCNASILNTPKPPACTITGVTISDTSWNKFNIPNGTSPSVWVHAHIGGLKGVPTTGVTTIQFVNVSISLNGTSYAMPDGVMIFDPSAPATPTTTFSGGKWTTTFNPTKLSDEMFFTGAAIPVSASVAAGAKATLTYTTQASVQGLSFNWQWSAAVFTFWPADWNQALIQPYHQGDHAGTPENTTVQKSLIQGPRGGGGSNFTGSWSATGSAACQ